MEHRLERQAHNESLSRTVNQQLATIDEGAAGWAEPDHLFEFVCECGADGGCDSRIELTLAEYERVREQTDRFAVKPGHESEALERVVERNPRFAIVDKRREYEPFATGEAGEREPEATS